MEFKDRQPAQLPGSDNGINRIRLEFKGYHPPAAPHPVHSINRIRLEFKVHGRWIGSVMASVLIESDWNLKSFNIT